MIIFVSWGYTEGKARGVKDSQKVGSDYHFVLGPLFWEGPYLEAWPYTHGKEKEKKRKEHLQKFQKLQILNLENIKNQEYYVTNSLFSLKNIGQTFEKSFVFLANLGKTCFLQFKKKTKSSFQQLKYTHTCALGTGFKLV
jgi:hypothetical protein